MTTRAEPPAPATERQKIVAPAFIAINPRKALPEVTAFQKLPDNFLDYRAKKSALDFALAFV